MKKFLRLTLIFLTPLLLFYSPYLIGDPFKVLRKYKTYYPEDGSPLWINNNRGYVSTQLYLQNKDANQWNSFIFGSSRSGAYLSDEWKKYIGPHCNCLHMDGYGESLYNLHKKIKFIDGKSHFDNALICIDEMLLTQTSPETGHLWITHPALEENKNWTNWHLSYLRAYSRPEFIRAYIDFSLTHKVKPYMIASGVIDTTPYGPYNLFSNENLPDQKIEDMREKEDWYTSERLSQFPSRAKTPEFYNPILKQKNITMLSEIADVLRRNHTNYKVIINPTYDQKLFDPKDMEILDSIFGNHLFDFSGRNLITEDYHNYYDPVHYKKRIGAMILRIIYIKDNTARKAAIDSLYCLN